MVALCRTTQDHVRERELEANRPRLCVVFLSKMHVYNILTVSRL